MSKVNIGELNLTEAVYTHSFSGHPRAVELPVRQCWQHVYRDEYLPSGKKPKKFSVWWVKGKKADGVPFFHLNRHKEVEEEAQEEKKGNFWYEKVPRDVEKKAVLRITEDWLHTFIKNCNKKTSRKRKRQVSPTSVIMDVSPPPHDPPAPRNGPTTDRDDLAVLDGLSAAMLPFQSESEGDAGVALLANNTELFHHHHHSAFGPHPAFGPHHHHY